jgi:hypothetical protein
MLIALLLASAQPAGADPAAAAALRAWTMCLTSAAERRTVSGASADAVAAAAAADCASEEDSVVAVHVRRQGAASATEGRAAYRRSARAFLAGRTRQRLAAIARDPVAAANAAHGGCVGERVGLEAASTSRSADSIVDEVLAACRPQEERLRAALAESRNPAFAETAVATIRRSARAEALSLVADLRRRLGTR